MESRVKKLETNLAQLEEDFDDLWLEYNSLLDCFLSVADLSTQYGLYIACEYPFSEPLEEDEITTGLLYWDECCPGPVKPGLRLIKK